MSEDEMARLARFLKAAGGDSIEIARRIIEITNAENAMQVRHLQGKIETFVDELNAHREEMRKDQEFLTQQVFSIVIGFREEIQTIDQKISKLARNLAIIKMLCIAILIFSILSIMPMRLGDIWILFTDHIMQIESDGRNSLDGSLLG